ncbi:MAG TPA: glycosyl hydrolase family 65 protein [Tepidisphaeraceae bacterium]|nr:glycosyl hydrolase family 65 protein [Tepidisphaeraceae bacterium]
MTSLRNLYWLHYKSNGPMATLWDEWLPPATLWPATGDKLRMRQRWARVLSNRDIDVEGYVSTHQHDGTAHANGWPFPLWHQGAGIGWHFVGTGVSGYEPPGLSRGDGWKLIGATGGAIDQRGWNIELTGPGATLQTPAFAVEVYHAPFLRLNWRASGLERSKPYVEWTTKDAPQFSADRRAYFAPATVNGEEHLAPPSNSQNTLTQRSGEVRSMIPMYKHPAWKGTITSLRIGFDNPSPGARMILKSFHTAYDTRHNINNFNYIRGVAWYFNWTRDLAFLRHNADRARTAMHYAMDEFQTRTRKLVFTPWVGHDGTSGVHLDQDGKKSIRAGRGIGNNYWDLMPFGGEDALATIYYYDALRDWADLEQAIADHPAWNVPAGALRFDPADLRKHADEVKAHAGQRFWNEKTGRFIAAIDSEGARHDYGYTFMNTEAIHHGFATDEQANSILSWLSGERMVDGDTSTGADIYHFRFGPRSTTKRNVGYYFWGWSNPEQIPFGYQVQDGGAVLGWSYHDLMARVKVRGPDDAWKRLREITGWFDEVQAEGGYRAYYRDPARGTMQGNNTPGGLGLDAEFVESVLVPQVMLYAFLGFEPGPVGFSVNPRLPEDWPSLEIRGIHFHDAVLSVSVARDEITITATKAPAQPMVIHLPPDFARLSYGTPVTLEKDVPIRSMRKE